MDRTPRIKRSKQTKRWASIRHTRSVCVPCEFQVSQHPAFPIPVPTLTANVETLGEELDRLVVLAKALERTAQVSQRRAFPSPVPKPTANVEMLGVELDRLVVLTEPLEIITQVA